MLLRDGLTEVFLECLMESKRNLARKPFRARQSFTVMRRYLTFPFLLKGQTIDQSSKDAPHDGGDPEQPELR